MALEAYNYYQFLQVDPEASPEVIEAAYRRLAKLYHPDYNASTEAMARMQELNCVYAVLKDPVQRRAYNQKLVEQKAPIERRWLGFALTPYNRTIVLSTAAATLFFFVIFSNPTATRTVTDSDLIYNETAQADYIKQAVIATIAALPQTQNSNVEPAVLSSTKPTVDSATPFQTSLSATGPQVETAKIPASKSPVPLQSPNSVEHKTVGQLLDGPPVAFHTSDNATQQTGVETQDIIVVKANTDTQSTAQQIAEAIKSVPVVTATARPTTSSALSTDSQAPSAVEDDATPTATQTATPQPTEAPLLVGANDAANSTVQEGIAAIVDSSLSAAPQTGGPIDADTALAAALQHEAPALPFELPPEVEENEPLASEQESPEVPISYTAELVYPLDNAEGGAVQAFEWYPSFSAEPDYGFELIFWRNGENPMEQGFGLAPPTTEFSVRVDLDDLDEVLGNQLNDGEYSWGVLYVQTSPDYQRVALITDKRSFRFSNFGTNGKAISNKKSPSSGE